MAKLPSLSELTKKLDVQKMVKDFRSLISPGHSTPEAPEGNEMAEKLAELIGVVNQLADTHAEQAKEIARVNSQLHELYKYAVNEQQTAEKSSESAETTDSDKASASASASTEGQQTQSAQQSSPESEKQQSKQKQSQSTAQQSSSDEGKGQSSGKKSQSSNKHGSQGQKTAKKSSKSSSDNGSEQSQSTDEQ